MLHIYKIPVSVKANEALKSVFLKLSCLMVCVITILLLLSAQAFSKTVSQNHSNPPHSIKGAKLSQCVLCHGPLAETKSPEEAPEIFQECSLWNHCIMCHGKGSAKGDGKAASFLYPKPRNLNSGILKFRETSVGEPP